MTSIASIRKIVATLAIAFALAFPVGVFAANATGSTAETLVLGSSISMTVTSVASYNGGTVKEAGIDVQNLTTNNPTGLTVNWTTSNLTGTAGTIPTTKRSSAVWSYNVDNPVVPTFGPARAEGFYATSATSALIVSTTTPIVDANVGGVMRVNTAGVAPGTYTGTLSFTASINP